MINYSGTIFADNDKIITAQNRAFRYGDGLFETMRLIKGEIPLLSYHFNRLLRGAIALHFQVPSYFNIQYLKNEILKTIDYQKFNGRVRFSIWRGGEGAYMPLSNLPEFLIQISPLPTPYFSMNKIGLVMGIFDELPLYSSKISCYKTCNALPYILAADFAKREGFDDAFLLHTEGGVAEAISSNVFIRQENQWFTPPLSEGCVEGVMRNFILQKMKMTNIIAQEKKISISQLKQADEVVLTNALQGVRWVAQIGEKKYNNIFSLQLADNLLDWIQHINE